MIRGILRAEEDAGPAKSNEARERGGILPAEDFKSLIRKFGKARDLWYVHNIIIKMRKSILNTFYFLTVLFGVTVIVLRSLIMMWELFQ